MRRLLPHRATVKWTCRQAAQDLARTACAAEPLRALQALAAPHRGLAWRRWRTRCAASERGLTEDLLNRAMHRPDARQRIDRILEYGDRHEALRGLRDENARSLPGNRAHLETGHWRNMLGRNMLASYFGKGLRVLDTCCGLGWGAYLVSLFAKEVVAVDIHEPAIEFARRTWPAPNVSWRVGSVLDLPRIGEAFPVALSMEALEHFDDADMLTYLDWLRDSVEPGGMLVGSTPVADTPEEADRAAAHNPAHLHICTREELERLLGERFRDCHIVPGTSLFWAVR